MLTVVATIRERAPGVHEVRVFLGRDESGRPKQVSRIVRGGKKDAKRVAAELEARPATVGAKHTVSELLDLWIAHREATWAPSTGRDQRSRAASVKADRISQVPLIRLSALDVDRWHARLREAGVGEGSVRNQHLVLRAAVTQAVRWGWLTTNVVAVARLGSRKTAPKVGMDGEALGKIMDAARTVDPAAPLAFRLAACTGARRSELAALRWSDIDDRGRITIDSSLAIIRHGSLSNRMSPTLRDDPTKTGNHRTLKVDSRTLAMLDVLRSERAQFGPWVLAVGDRPINPERLTSWWALARKRAGVDPKWRLHDLRHWAATTSISGGHDLRTVANRLGHANPAMTLRVYAHALPAPDEDIAEALGEALDRIIA
jgi:integrase